MEVSDSVYQGGSIIIRKRLGALMTHSKRTVMLKQDRYSEFQELRERLLLTFPHAGRAMPELPPKSLIRTSFSQDKHVGSDLRVQINSGPISLRNGEKD